MGINCPYIVLYKLPPLLSELFHVASFPSSCTCPYPASFPSQVKMMPRLLRQPLHSQNPSPTNHPQHDTSTQHQQTWPSRLSSTLPGRAQLWMHPESRPQR